jgi:hypothetical protein
VKKHCRLSGTHTHTHSDGNSNGGQIARCSHGDANGGNSNGNGDSSTNDGGRNNNGGGIVYGSGSGGGCWGEVSSSTVVQLQLMVEGLLPGLLVRTDYACVCVYVCAHVCVFALQTVKPHPLQATLDP